MPYDGSTFFDVHEPQFSHEDIGHIFFPDTMLKLANWQIAGYVKPSYVKDPRGGKPRRRYSIVDIARIGIIDQLVNGIGLRPSHAAEIADFAITFLHETFDRHPDAELKSKALIYVTSWLDRDSGKFKSNVYYRKLEDPGPVYTEDPYLNPDAKQFVSFTGVAIHLPLTHTFNRYFLTASEFLTNHKRGGMDKFRRPVDAE